MKTYTDEELLHFIELTETIHDAVYLDNDEQLEYIGTVYDGAVRIYADMIMNMAKYKEIGIDIPGKILCQQLENLNDAIKYKDFVSIADTMYYEIREGLLFYKDVKDEIAYE